MVLVSNIITTAASLALIVVGIILSFHSAAAAGTLLGFGFLFVVLLLLAKFKRFKGFGFEAEMWEQKQEEAAELVASLKRMQVAYAKAIFLTVADPDPTLHPNQKYARRDAIKETVLNELEAAGIRGDKIREVRDVERNGVMAEYVIAIDTLVYKTLNGKDPNPWQHAYNTMGPYPTPDMLDAALKSCRIGSHDLNEMMSDYRHYRETGIHRRPDVWTKRGDWMRRYIGWDR